MLILSLEFVCRSVIRNWPLIQAKNTQPFLRWSNGLELGIDWFVFNFPVHVISRKIAIEPSPPDEMREQFNITMEEYNKRPVGIHQSFLAGICVRFLTGRC